jgi:hypothetical protein
MNRREIMVATLAGAGTLLLGGCGLFERRANYRFRMTLEAHTPQGPRAGSGVMEQTAQA